MTPLTDKYYHFPPAATNQRSSAIIWFTGLTANFSPSHPVAPSQQTTTTTLPSAARRGPPRPPLTFLACQQEELLVQRGLLLHLSHVFQGQKFVRRGGVGALIQSCHYDGKRIRPNTEAHPTSESDDHY